MKSSIQSILGAGVVSSAPGDPVRHIAPMRFRATAVILAGGNSSRMGRDKRFLPFAGRPLIQIIAAQVRPHFEELVIAANDGCAVAGCGIRVVADEIPGLGPIGGMVSSMAASHHDTCFVLPCDMPQIDLALIARLLDSARRGDCAIPVSAEGRYEPLFAAYRKRVLPFLRRAIACGVYKVMDALRDCKIVSVNLPTAEGLQNLNTLDDYRRWLDTQPAGNSSGVIF